MPIYPDREPLHTGSDLELIQKLTRECNSLYEIALRALAALGWRHDNDRDCWWKPGNGTDPPTITGPAIDELCRRNDDPERLARIMISMGWEREGRIIWRAAEDLPTYVRFANHMAGRGL